MMVCTFGQFAQAFLAGGVAGAIIVVLVSVACWRMFK